MDNYCRPKWINWERTVRRAMAGPYVILKMRILDYKQRELVEATRLEF